jgi:hypothetical protein
VLTSQLKGFASMFMPVTPEVEKLLVEHSLPYYRMDGDGDSLYVVLVRPEDLPRVLVPHILAVRTSPLRVGGKYVEGFPEEYRKGWPHSLSDEEARELGIVKSSERRLMGGHSPPTVM